eukprot:6176785-Pleurochrysis_carterae.AAC.1
MHSLPVRACSRHVGVRLHLVRVRSQRVGVRTPALGVVPASAQVFVEPERTQQGKMPQSFRHREANHGPGIMHECHLMERDHVRHTYAEH